MLKNFGPFYKHAVPGVGQGLLGQVYSITAPNEMLKVIRSEGAYPSGGIQFMWPLIEALKENNSPIFTDSDVGLLGQSEGWKTQRTFLQTGMLDPKAAKAYVPGIVQAAQLASQGAPDASHRNQLNYYLNLCAFDMFSSFMLGELTQCANRSSVEDSENALNIQFCNAVIASMEQMMQVAMSPMEILAHKIGYRTTAYKNYASSWNTVHAIGMEKLKRFHERYKHGELNEIERNSYFANALDRFNDNSQLTHEQVMELSVMVLNAGVDTTSSVTAWVMMHLALNPEVQENLYNELQQALKLSSPDGKTITAATLEKKYTPYLHAVLRENYRLTPPVPSVTTKTVSQGEVTVHGLTLSTGSVVSLENPWNIPSEQMPDAAEFKPERWLAPAVEARKGTALEVMDHALFRDSFGQGARRCPGSRVATLEVLAMTAQLVLDWKMQVPANISNLHDVEYRMSAMISPILPPIKFTARN